MARQIKDEYELLEEIGAGGMAVVHKAMQKSLKRPVAIKELKKTYHGDEQIVQRFERESMVAASLQHENIVHIYDYWKKPNYCIVMEYVDGINLADIIDHAGVLPVDIAIMIAIQVCSALDYAHMRGLIHRDIKPGNIMVKRNGEIKLMDFGIAHTRSLESLTVPGTLIGTPAYMSPEQILGQNLDVRSDIFSFGIVLYEMFTGRKPFLDDETRSVSTRIVKDKIVSPRRINRQIPVGVQRVIKKCLNKKPQKRFGSMLEIQNKLGKRLAGKTTKPLSLNRIAEYLLSLDVVEPASEQETLVITARPPRRRWGRTALAAGLLLFAASAGAFYFNVADFVRPATPAPAPPVSSAAQSPAVQSPPAAPAAPASSVNAARPALRSSATTSPVPKTTAVPEITARHSSRAASPPEQKREKPSLQKKNPGGKKKKKRSRRTRISD